MYKFLLSASIIFLKTSAKDRELVHLEKSKIMAEITVGSCTAHYPDPASLERQFWHGVSRDCGHNDFRRIFTPCPFKLAVGVSDDKTPV